MEELPPQLDGGENTEESLAERGEGRQQHHRVWSKVVRLEAVKLQERAEESARRQPQAARQVGAEHDALTLRRCRRHLLLLRGAGLHEVRAGDAARPAKKLDGVVVNFRAVPHAGVDGGGRGGGRRAHRREQGVVRRGSSEKKKEEEGTKGSR